MSTAMDNVIQKILPILFLTSLSSFSQIMGLSLDQDPIYHYDNTSSINLKIELLESRLSLLAKEISNLNQVTRCSQKCERPRYQDEANSANSTTEVATTTTTTLTSTSASSVSAEIASLVGSLQLEAIGKTQSSLNQQPYDYSGEKSNRPQAFKRQFRSLEQQDNRQANFFRGERGEPGKNGLDGIPGLDGAPGLDGVPGLDGREGKDGINGNDGKDGKDGTPGVRGPVGPPGPPGEMGKRGKQGAPGKTGAPGQPGICAYKAKYDCSLISNNVTVNSNGGGSNGAAVSGNEQMQAALLVAPTMIGHEQSSISGDLSQNGIGGFTEERQVTVKEGDYIQLSCEAFGLPKPEYTWRRPDKRSTILIDTVSDLKVTSFPGSQLPFIGVDRLQAGGYECVASNGVPPEAIKQINLDVNYVPTIRIYPGPSVYRVSFGSSILVECIVDANPSSFSYWMFGSDLIMSIAPPNAQQQRGTSEFDGGNDGRLLNYVDANNRHYGGGGGGGGGKKHIITESAGQLSNGAYYSILTLNITNIGPDDLGLYKCISRNLIGQSTGYVWLESTSDSSASIGLVEERKFRELILEKNSLVHERLDNTVGWPNYLIEREANYSTFGNEHRNYIQMLNSRESPKKGVVVVSPLTNLSESSSTSGSYRKIVSLLEPPPSSSMHNSTTHEITNTNKHNIKGNQNFVDSGMRKFKHSGGVDLASFNFIDDGNDDGMGDSCRIEKSLGDPNLIQSNLRKSTISLLDQVGKPVYVGSVAGGSLDWWSLDSKPTPLDATDPSSSLSPYYYATLSNNTDSLFEYDSLSDLLKDQQQQQQSATNQPPSNHDFNLANPTTKRRYKLNSQMFGSSHLIYGKYFIYASQISAGPLNYEAGLDSIQVTIQELKTNQCQHLKLDDKILRSIQNQPIDLGSDYKMNRIEFASDENGVWLIFPTVEESQPLKFGSSLESQKNPLITNRIKTRRLHVLKLKQPPDQLASSGIEIDYHVSMRLDWRKIGQMFIIDGVLYGIEDRHKYSSKLQFAYDLYKCKLLSTDYLNEPHRTITNHFGNTQMIKYNPSKPKRLYTIDNGNLLWCPVKLIATNQNEIWQQQKQENIL